MMREPPLPVDDDTPCIGCGLCCDGTLHPNVNVAPDDTDATAAAGLDLVRIDGKLVFRQPCPMFSGACCSIYELRPPVCRTYRCALLRDVENGQVSVAVAREKVTMAKALIAKVLATTPEATTSDRRAAISKNLQTGYEALAPSEKASSAQALLNIVALDRFLDRWFRRRRDQSSAS